MVERTVRNTLVCVLGITSLLLAPSCKKVASDDLKDSVPYYQEYVVDYNKDNNKTSASAMFRVREKNGATVDLNNGASVTANNQSPNGLQLLPGVYNWNFEGLPDVTFMLNKNSGVAIVNSVAKSDIGDIAFPSGFPATVSKASGLSYNWAGTALTNGETLTVSITGTPASSGIDPKVEKNITNGQVIFSTTDLEKFAPGTITITMERNKNMILDTKDDTANGNIELNIKTKKELVLN